MKPGALLLLGREALSAWNADGGPRLGAALAYYTFFSMAPLVIIVTAVAGFVFGEEAARGQLFRQMRELIGPDAASAVQSVVARADRPAQGVLAALLGLATLVLGASAVVSELQATLNHIFRVAAPAGLWATLRKRVLSAAMVIGFGFLLLVSLILNSVISAAGAYLGGLTGIPDTAFRFADLLVSAATIMLVFAAIFKWLPDNDLEWREVWLGAAATTLLFMGGKHLLALYLGRSVVSPFGAAGSLVLVLLWVYYSAQILYLGAEFTRLHALAARSDAIMAGLGIKKPAGPTRVYPHWLRERRTGPDRRHGGRGRGDRPG